MNSDLKQGYPRFAHALSTCLTGIFNNFNTSLPTGHSSYVEPPFYQNTQKFIYKMHFTKNVNVTVYAHKKELLYIDANPADSHNVDHEGRNRLDIQDRYRLRI